MFRTKLPVITRGLGWIGVRSAVAARLEGGKVDEEKRSTPAAKAWAYETFYLIPVLSLRSRGADAKYYAIIVVGDADRPGR